MKAAFAIKFGGPEVIEIRDTTKPEPKKNEVLVKLKATTVTSGDARIRGSNFPKGFSIPARLALGIFAPRTKVLGSEFSGVVEAVGSEVKDFKIGDEVIGFRVFNVHAEYVCINASSAIVKKPANITFEEAAAFPFGGSTALFFLNEGKLKQGESILINGASGSVGIMAVQIAKAMGANVTAVCGTQNIELIKSFGADSVVDYKVTPKVLQSKYDIVMDTVGNLNFSEVVNHLNENGRFLQLVTGLKNIIFPPKGPNNTKQINPTAPEKKELLEDLIKLYNENKLKPVIGKTFSFDDISEAHAYVDSGRKVGSAVLVF